MDTKISNDYNYEEPVRQLIKLGDVRGQKKRIDYLALGLGPDHVPALSRMILDKDLWWSEEDEAEVWSAVHAWRALAQIRSEHAIEALVELMARVDAYNDDWTQSELPDVFAAHGLVTLPFLIAFIADDSQGVRARVTAIDSVEKIVLAHPEAREECVFALTKQLKHFSRQDQILNAFLLDILVEWKAVDAAEIMERAFSSNAIDLTMRGDWEDVQIELGLLEKRITPRRNYMFERMFGRPDPALARIPSETPPGEKRRPSDDTNVQDQVQAERQSHTAAKKKRKQQKKARRKQRKRRK